MNRKSNRPKAIRWPSTAPMPHTAASARPVFTRAASTRSGYRFWSTKCSGSMDVSPASCSTKLPSSRSRSMRSPMLIRKWCPQVGQTRRFRSSCRLKTCWSQLGHLVHASVGPARRRLNGNLMGIG